MKGKNYPALKSYLKLEIKMYTLIAIIHVIVAVFLILLVLLQVGKSAGLEGILGGGGSERLFSLPSGTALIRKVTAVVAIIFVLTTLSLTIIAHKKKAKSVVDKVPIEAQR